MHLKEIYNTLMQQMEVWVVFGVHVRFQVSNEVSGVGVLDKVSEVIIRSLKLSDLAQKGFDANFGENKQINY